MSSKCSLNSPIIGKYFRCFLPSLPLLLPFALHLYPSLQYMYYSFIIFVYSRNFLRLSLVITIRKKSKINFPFKYCENSRVSCYCCLCCYYSHRFSHTLRFHISMEMMCACFKRGSDQFHIAQNKIICKYTDHHDR